MLCISYSFSFALLEEGRLHIALGSMILEMMYGLAQVAYTQDFKDIQKLWPQYGHQVVV